MPNEQAFSQGFSEAIDRIPARQRPKRRGLRMRAGAGAADGMTASAVFRQQRLAAFE
jgi:hypothetical protein